MCVCVQNLQIWLSVDSTARVPLTTLSRRHKRVCSIAARVWRTLCSAMKSISIFELRSSNSPRIRDSWSPTPFRYARGWLAQHKIKHTLIETATHFERYETAQSLRKAKLFCLLGPRPHVSSVSTSSTATDPSSLNYCTGNTKLGKVKSRCAASDASTDDLRRIRDQATRDLKPIATKNPKLTTKSTLWGISEIDISASMLFSNQKDFVGFGTGIISWRQCEPAPDPPSESELTQYFKFATVRHGPLEERRGK